ANLEGASLEGAKLKGARLNYAQLELANLGGAILEGAQLTNADLREAYLGGAKAVRVDLQFARMEKVNLEEADLTEANLKEAALKSAYSEGVNLTRAILEGSNFENAALARANFTEADLRHSNLRNAKLTGAKMTGAKLHGLEAAPEHLREVVAEWVDFSKEGDASTKIPGNNIVDHYKQMKDGVVAAAVPAAVAVTPPPQTTTDQNKRFFGKGDVLRNATLEFGQKSLVEIESKFENCSITLGEGAKLTIGPNGVLEGCQITGSGEIVVYGRFSENGSSPGIIGPKVLIVGKTGSVSGAVLQPSELTQFAFERGCHLKLKIMTSK
ncbi:MAG: pentapeptide repeat-containing protein, partial [Blastocatellia bacterium]|nr:pentapeptide repeat-containing protein [Blastocatellia bacterium]